MAAPCRYEKILYPYSFGEMSEEENKKILKHLNKCASCMKIVKQINQSRKAFLRDSKKDDDSEMKFKLNYLINDISESKKKVYMAIDKDLEEISEKFPEISFNDINSSIPYAKFVRAVDDLYNYVSKKYKKTLKREQE